MTDLHAAIAHAAMRASRRPVEVTGSTPLHPHLDAPHVHVLVEWRAELVVLVFILAGCRLEKKKDGERGLT